MIGSRGGLKAAIAGAIVSLILLVLAWSVRIHDVNSLTGRTITNCQQLERVKAYILQALQRSEATVPTFSYYKEHPGELRHALAEIRREQRQFAPQPCN